MAKLIFSPNPNITGITPGLPSRLVLAAAGQYLPGSSTGGGTVTSVGLILPGSLFNVTGSPVTVAGNLTGSLVTQSANLVFAGPTSGGPATPTFRSLVAADIPTLNQNTTGSAGSVAFSGITGITGTPTGSKFLRDDGSWQTVSSGGGTWGSITGTLTSQTDLNTALNARLVAASNLRDITNAATARGNLGLGNVENTALSTWAGSSNINTVGTLATLSVLSGDAGVVLDAGTGKITLTNNNNSIQILPTLLTRSTFLTWPQVDGTLLTDGSGLNANNLTSGTVPTARLGSGTANSSTYLRGDGSWATVSGGGSYSAGTGLTLTGSTFSVNTSQNISTLSNLTSNGFVKTSGSTGALSIDTGLYAPLSSSSTLASSITGSSLTSVGTLVSGAVPTSLLTGTIGTDQLASISGTGAVVLATGASFTSATLGNCNISSGGLTFLGSNANVTVAVDSGGHGNTFLWPASLPIGTYTVMTTGTGVAASQLPALTGDVTTSAGTVATTVGKINGVSLAGLTTGLLKNTTGTGAPSIATAGTDYVVPSVTTLSSLTTVAGGTLGTAAFQPTSAFDAAGTAAGVLPSQTGNSGKYLTTNGTSVSWATVVWSQIGSTPTTLLGYGVANPVGLTAGSYTNANITVGADGRVTAASNGSGGGGAGLTANTFTDTQTITQATANHGILASTGYNNTSGAVNMIDLAGTWNTSGSPTAIKVNITNTASGSSAKFIDFQIGGTSNFSVAKSGVVTMAGMYCSGNLNLNNSAILYATSSGISIPDPTNGGNVLFTTNDGGSSTTVVVPSVVAGSVNMLTDGSLLNGSLIASGTVSNARLPATISQTNLTAAHYAGSGSAPTIAGGSGAGTSPTVSVTGTDAGGYISVTTGSSPSGTNAIVATVTFATAFTTTIPRSITLNPANASAAALGSTTTVFVDQASTTLSVFVLKSGSSALTASTTYKWYYTVKQ